MISIEYIHKLLDVYNQLCRPLCQQTGIFCSSFESTRYRIPSNIKLTFRTFTFFSPKTPKNLLSVHFSIIVNIPDGFTSAVR